MISMSTWVVIKEIQGSLLEQNSAEEVMIPGVVLQCQTIQALPLEVGPAPKTDILDNSTFLPRVIEASLAMFTFCCLNISCLIRPWRLGSKNIEDKP
jgi:hypothetical protein